MCYSNNRSLQFNKGPERLKGGKSNEKKKVASDGYVSDNCGLY
jgi:hypothetical protein